MSRLVDRAATRLADLTSRRSFLSRTAMVGTAMAVAPTSYVLKPRSAYAAVCNCSGSSCDCGSLCCDGYTEFCCTIYGDNDCPPGSIVAGWWKADGSGYCGSGPRYYYDCNSRCGSCGCGSSGTCSGSCSGTPCGCGQGDCNNRKAGCTRFRYGQCNQSTQCVGPIICRVVTCTPPWQLFADECSTATATDNNTRFHNRPCLQIGPSGMVTSLVPDPRGARVRGWAVDASIRTSPIAVHIYVDGRFHSGTRADVTRTDFTDTHPNYGTDHGFDSRLQLSPGEHRVCVYGINNNSSGPNALLGCRTITVTRPGGAPPFGNLEQVDARRGGFRVRGWAIDPDTSGPVTVRIYVDGRFHHGLPARVERPDVERAHPGRGSSHGFDTTIGTSPGRHEVCVYAINTNGSGPHRLLGCRTVSTLTDRAPFGWLEAVAAGPNGVRVQGWAIDPDDSTPITVRVYIDGRFAGGFVADEHRPDVGARYPVSGNRHGFNEILPMARGRHEVCVYAINDGGTGANTLLGCRTVNRT